MTPTVRARLTDLILSELRAARAAAIAAGANPAHVDAVLRRRYDKLRGE